ncbi:helix-turn-helix domain-containing protein [Sphingobium sp. TCM1]|uniref:helix-turn-helix domain-containing protein n=1 Tax=Sphingobium sp. TCM1 TaxID=453246 RepID=UPI003FA79958
MVEYHRKSRNVSGREVARSIGISSATYSRVTRGHPPDVETYLRLKRWIEGGAAHG